MKKFLALLSALAIMLSLAACGGSSSSESTTEESISSGTESSSSNSSSTGSTAVTIGYVGTHYACYPSSTSSEDFLCQYMVYDQLFEVDNTTGEYSSRVLESWEWTDVQTLFMTL